MEIPKGFVLTPRGGRPPRHARDMAVLLMKLLMVEHRKGKASVFEREAVKLFRLADGADVRKRVRQAKLIYGSGSWMVINDLVMYQPEGRSLLHWQWREGWTEAAKVSGYCIGLRGCPIIR